MQPSQGAPSHHFPYESSNDVAKKDPRAPCLMPAWEILISWYKLVIFYHLDVPGWKLRSMVGTWVIIPILILINGHARNLQVYLARNGPARVMHQSKTEDTGRPCCTGRPASLGFCFWCQQPHSCLDKSTTRCGGCSTWHATVHTVLQSQPRLGTDAISYGKCSPGRAHFAPNVCILVTAPMAVASSLATFDSVCGLFKTVCFSILQHKDFMFCPDRSMGGVIS